MPQLELRVRFEQERLRKGTSSRSTKLAHGGVRFWSRHIGLVMEALKERGLAFRNAPHLVHVSAFVGELRLVERHSTVST